MTDQTLTLDLSSLPADDALPINEACTGDGSEAKLQEKIAERLDQYASLLEDGEETAAEAFLHKHPELQAEAGGHLESLQLLCRMSRSAAKPADCVESLNRPPTLGDYELQGEIGRGGMGIVYEATQLSLRRRVALKVLPFAAVLNQDQVARFRNEAHAAASLHHPHIVPVYAVGCERGVHYYSMQLINGNTLEQTLDELRTISGDSTVASATSLTENVEPPSTTVVNRGGTTTLRSVRQRDGVRAIVKMFVDVADAIDYAHEQGVIHRDIKPSNLLVDAAGKVWVADFGLARCRDAGNLTAEGKAIGTARYMSPEQIMGRPQEVDHRTDIYSLGITLYELLTLQPAFGGRCRQRLMETVATEPPVAPRRINAAIPTDLETIVLKAIAKSKDERYSTCGELAEDLRRFLSGQPTLARRPSRVDVAFRWAVRHRVAVMTSFAVLLFALVGFAAATTVVLHHSRQKDVALDQARHHLNQAHSAVQRFGGLTVDRLNSIEGTGELQRDLLTEARNYFVDFVTYASDDSRFRGELAKVQFLLGATECRLGTLEAAEAAYLSAAEGLQALVEEGAADVQTQSDLALCVHNLAALHKDTGRYKEAIAEYKRATTLHERVMLQTGVPHETVANWGATQTNYATLLWESGESRDAIGRLRDAEVVLERHLDDQATNRHTRQQLIECRNTLAGLLMDDHADEAERLLEENIASLAATERLEETEGSFGSSAAALTPECQLAIAQSNLASLLGKQQRIEEAIELTHTSIGTFRDAMRRRPEDTALQQQLAIAQNNLGQLLWNQGTSQDARSAFLEAEKGFKTLCESQAQEPQLLSRFAGVLHNLGVLDQEQGQLDSAVQRLTEAMEYQALAVRMSPFHQGYRQYLERHNELLDQILRQLKQKTETTQKSVGGDSPPTLKTQAASCKEREYVFS
ncbi:MAG: protein kinase [Rhodopirellula sp. JB044]|uniref:protein kinase domain-containing protein n=1 Tax=Rhodopirellula sp. JB044 TaxID=3342844 RepID=UPI00370CA9C1